MVRHQPSKLTFAGSNPVSRSKLRVQVSGFFVSRGTEKSGIWLLRGPVAQRLEQTTHNRLVAGSNPAGPTFFMFFMGKLFFW